MSERDGGSVWVIKEYVRDSRLKESVRSAMLTTRRRRRRRRRRWRRRNAERYIERRGEEEEESTIQMALCRAMPLCVVSKTMTASPKSLTLTLNSDSKS